MLGSGVMPDLSHLVLLLEVFKVQFDVFFIAFSALSTILIRRVVAGNSFKNSESLMAR